MPLEVEVATPIPIKTHLEVTVVQILDFIKSGPLVYLITKGMKRIIYTRRLVEEAGIVQVKNNILLRILLYKNPIYLLSVQISFNNFLSKSSSPPSSGVGRGTHAVWQFYLICFLDELDLHDQY